MKKLDRTGEKKFMNCGEEAEIIEYRTATDITVSFKKFNEKIKSDYGNFKKGTIKSKYSKSVYGVGYFGQGKYTERVNGICCNNYKYWFSMMNRCYCKNKHYRPTYKNVTVSEEWHDYQNFAKWFDNNYYEIENEQMCLDKDILHKGNKTYSPKNCVFVPSRINSLFTKCNKNRGKYPIGVSYEKASNTFLSNCSHLDNGKKKQKFLGYFKTAEEAFKTYKAHKEKYIKQVADEYKDKIPKTLYDAMCNWIVEIDD
ncbi:hypothetical protein [Clostridium sp. VAP52]|uniref:hypothetical protein n=1 Tax=Clostridium sp. VAP52 TaxID=2949977 RepID=UPI002079D356|nr:hypothetical protein [Clostridium sp. VAP52]